MEKSIAVVGASGNSLVLNRPHNVRGGSGVSGEALVDGVLVDLQVFEDLGVPKKGCRKVGPFDADFDQRLPIDGNNPFAS